ncbi:MAG: hypothetical protein QOJ42_818 [Acidobacteriaceae bacterium]|jgi:hypothetical protein|nr:hypothetical protein [Acidobacteriaceae bacterium]
MKLAFRTPFSKTLNLIASFCLALSILSVAEAGSRDPLFPDSGGAGLNHEAKSLQGYLMVYSATDQFDDGGTLYYAHSSYSIYTEDGKLFKNVENHISRSDEIPALVTLAAGSYTIEARSESRGYVRVRVVITAGWPTILDPDMEQAGLPKRLPRTKQSRRLAER